MQVYDLWLGSWKNDETGSSEPSSASGTDITARRLVANNFWNDMIARGESAGNYADGMMDVFEDATGLDADNSTNLLLSSLAGFDEYSTMYIEGDVTPFTDTGGHSVTNNGVTLDSTYKVKGDGAMYFADSAYLELASSADWTLGNTWTLCMWVRTTSIGGMQKIISTRGWDETGYEFGIDSSGAIRAELFPGGGKVGTNALSENTWSHIAITYDGTYLKFYLNGTLDNTFEVSFGWGTSNVMRIGCPEPYSEPLYGQLDDLRLYKGAVLYTENFDPTVDPFPGYIVPSETGGTADNMTAISAGVVSVFTPTKGYVDLMVETTGTADTDWFIDVLESTGNWTNAPLTLVQDFGSNIKRYTAEASLTNADINRAYRIRTLNNTDFKCTNVLHTWEA